MAASSSSSSAIRPVEIIPSRGQHKATIVWLHDMRADNYEYPVSSSLQVVEILKTLNNVKLICLKSQVLDLSASPRRLTITGDDQVVLDRKAREVAKHLSGEPTNVIKGVGGLGFGAEVALKYATDCALDEPYSCTITPTVVVGINGWLSMAENIKSSIESTVEAADRAASQSIFLTHGRGELEAATIREAGFGEVKFLPLECIGEIGREVKVWLKEKLKLDVVQ